jgi:hypothetical protein
MNVGHQEVHKTSSGGGAMIVANFQAKECACPFRLVQNPFTEQNPPFGGYPAMVGRKKIAP